MSRDPKGGKPRWSEDERRTIETMMARGLSWGLIGETLGRAPSAVRRHAQRIGLHHPSEDQLAWRRDRRDLAGWPRPHGDDAVFVRRIVEEAQRIGLLRVTPRDNDPQVDICLCNTAKAVHRPLTVDANLSP